MWSVRHFNSLWSASCLNGRLVVQHGMIGTTLCQECILQDSNPPTERRKPLGLSLDQRSTLKLEWKRRVFTSLVLRLCVRYSSSSYMQRPETLTCRTDVLTASTYTLRTWNLAHRMSIKSTKCKGDGLTFLSHLCLTLWARLSLLELDTDRKQATTHLVHSAHAYTPARRPKASL